MKKASELRRIFSATTWAIQPEFLSTMLASLELLTVGGSVAEQVTASLKAANEFQAARRQKISESTGGTVVVLPLYGLITQRSNWMSYYFGGTTTEGFTMAFRQALADDSVTAIVIDVDSPGGSVSGVDELAAEIYAARTKKTIIAVSNTLNASAAYYISSAASEVVVMPSSLTGSIGVYNSHEDDSEWLAKLGVKISLISAGKYKVEANSYEPLTPEARAAMQQMVDGYYNLFVKAVAKGRGVKAQDVRDGFGQGRVLMATDAVAAGLADRIGTLDSVLAKFGVARPTDGLGYAAAEVEAPTAEVSTVIPAAKKKDSDDSDDDSEGAPDDDSDANGDPCECPCDLCMKGDCSGCTADDCNADNCQCEAAKKKMTDAKAAADEKALAFERQQIAIALAL